VSSSASETHVAHPGERRHLTVLFCDLVGSTEIAGRLDPEEWHEMVAGYHRAATKAITRYGGHVAKYLGDGVMAYFGWPEAHENDAERATRAGLGILDEVARFNQGSTYPKVSVRVGIDSGSVVVDVGVGKETDLFGEAPNIAARVQNAAAPDSLLLTASTHRLVSGLFVVEELGTQELKGIANPVLLYRVLRSTGVRGRLAAAPGLTPFVGRDEELRLLLSRWERARGGEGQLALVVGEAGIGKSRLVAEFHERIRETPHIWMESAGEQLFENTPLHAVTEMLSRWLELQVGKNADEGVEQLETALASAGLKLADAVPLVADLIQLPLGDRYPALTLPPEQKRRRLLAALAGWVIGAAKLQPVVLVLEDLHWLDPSTFELLQLFAEQGATVPLMLLHTARPEFRASWPMRTHQSQITLSRLSPGNVREMIALVALRNALAVESVEAVVERTGGVPLFVEELTRAVLESGDTRSTGHGIPATLHDSLMARLDRLGPAKEAIQIGAVIGSEFSYELLHAIYPLPEEDLQNALRVLANAELVYERGIAPDATYLFKHALIRDAAYEALLRSKRRQYHGKIADVLQERFSATVDERPELLATHYTEAGLIERAVPFWQRAGQKALERSANQEAIRHLNKGLDLLGRLPETPERLQQELLLQLALGTATIATKGFASAEVEGIYERSKQLCQQAGEVPDIFPILWGLWLFYTSRGQHLTARELAQQCLRLAQKAGDTVLLVHAHHVSGVGLIALGDFAQALNHLQQAISMYDLQQHASHAHVYGHDLGAVSNIHESWALWFLGYPQQAVMKYSEGMARAQKLGHPYTSANAAAFAAWLHHFCRNHQAVDELASIALNLSVEHDFAFYRVWSMMLRGYARTETGDLSEGLAEMRAGLEAYQVMGAETCKPAFLSLLAEAYSKIGQADDGLSLLGEAMSGVNITRECWWEAELYRLKGELTLKQSRVQSLRSEDHTEIEQCFRQSLTIARAQHAKSLELRATMSLTRLLVQEGRVDEGRAMLAEIYNWFTEGFDTADLKEARELLDGLNA
jgi:predicted ATPase/class 3 adenylate cyclase